MWFCHLTHLPSFLVVLCGTALRDLVRTSYSFAAKLRDLSTKKHPSRTKQLLPNIPDNGNLSVESDCAELGCLFTEFCKINAFAGLWFVSFPDNRRIRHFFSGCHDFGMMPTNCRVLNLCRRTVLRHSTTNSKDYPGAQRYTWPSILHIHWILWMNRTFIQYWSASDQWRIMACETYLATWATNRELVMRRT